MNECEDWDGLWAEGAHVLEQPTVLRLQQLHRVTCHCEFCGGGCVHKVEARVITIFDVSGSMTLQVSVLKLFKWNPACLPVLTVCQFYAKTSLKC